MTRRERALAAFRHRPTDRAALAGGWEVDALFLIEAAGATRSQYQADRRAVSIQAFKNLGYDVLFELAPPDLAADDPAGRGGTAEEVARTYKQALKEHAEKYPTAESVIAALSDPAGETESERYHTTYESSRGWAREWTRASPDLPSILRWGPTPGFQGYVTFGYVPWLSALTLYPDEIGKYFARNAVLGRQQAVAMTQVIQEENLLPAVYLGEDICMNSGPLCSPAALREIYFPHLKTCLEPFVAADIEIVWHSDGNILPLVDDLLLCGVTGFQGLQDEIFLPENHQVRLDKLVQKRTRTGHPPIIVGGLSTRDVLTFGTIDEIKRKVEYCLDTMAPYGGFFLSAYGNKTPDIPSESYYAAFRHALEYSAARDGNQCP